MHQGLKSGVWMNCDRCAPICRCPWTPRLGLSFLIIAFATSLSALNHEIPEVTGHGLVVKNCFVVSYGFFMFLWPCMYDADDSVLLELSQQLAISSTDSKQNNHCTALGIDQAALTLLKVLLSSISHQCSLMFSIKLHRPGTSAISSGSSYKVSKHLPSREIWRTGGLGIA